jgi:hypothetical protein
MQPQFGGGGFLGNSNAPSRGAGLLGGRRGGSFSNPGFASLSPMPVSGFADLTRFSGTREKPGLLVRQGGSGEQVLVGTGAEPLVQPDAAVRRETLTESGVAGQTGAKVPLEQLVQSYVASHRETYMAQGWQRFKEGQYRVATDLFSMADSVSVSEPGARIPIKRAMVAAGIASRQYSLAGNALSWLLSDDPVSKTARDPAILENLRNLAANYGESEAGQRDYSEQAAVLIALATANPDSIETQALRVIVLWGQNDRSSAEFYAQKLREEKPGQSNEPWKRLWPAMQAASQATPAARTPTTGPALITMDDPVAGSRQPQ